MAVGNSLGAVVLWDGENPRTFTGTAGETISGGQFVYVSGASGTAQVGSQASSFQDGDLVIKLCDDISRCNGLALNNVTSDELITIATRGNYLIKAANDISGGNLVIQNGIPDAVSAAGITSTGSWQGLVGRALTNAGSEDYCLVSLNI